MIFRILTLFLLLSAGHVLGQDTEYDTRINALTEKGYAHYGVQKDSGQSYFKEIERLAFEQADTLTLLDILITSNRHLGYFYDLQTIRDNLKKIDGIADPKSDFWLGLEDSLFYKNSIRYDKGNYYFKLGDGRKARTYFQDIRHSYQNKPPETLSTEHFELFSGALSFLAKIYESEDKFDLAKDYYLRNISLLKKVSPENSSALNINFALLAEVLTEQGEFDQANGYLLTTLDEALRQNNNPNRILSVAHNLAENYMALSKPDSARQYLSLMADQLDRSPHFGQRYHRTKAQWEQQSGNTSEALIEIDAALTSYLSSPAQISEETLANLHLEKGRLLATAKRSTSALKSALDGLDALSHNFGTTYLELTALRSESLLNLEKFKEADNVALSAIGMLDSLKADYQYTADKINLIEKTFPLFESAIEANYALFRKTSDTKYIDQAFFFMEKSKSVLLLESLFASRADQFAGVPDSLLEKERLLGFELTALEKKLQKNTNEITGGNSELQDTIFKLREQRTDLLNSVSIDYPDYYALRYGATIVTPEKVVKKLHDEEVLISYFYGNRAIYAISVRRETKQILKIPLEKSLENDIETMYRMLSDPKSDIQELGRTSHRIFTIILEPLLTKTEKRKLTIVPDGLLNYVPFSALNTDRERLKYLTEDYAIAYTNSATLLFELRQREVQKNGVLAFAPSFDGTAEVNTDRSKLSPLPHNKREVTQVLNFMQGKSFLDREATLKNFRSEFQNFGILHLATHAVFDDRTPEYSYLAFSQNDTDKSEDVLFTADLYNLKINADLVALSACETGLGALKRGEGFMSLAHGFFYSGASSLLSTLWKVNDGSSAQLMGDFYKNLAEGETKDVALQKSQKQFLKSNSQNALAHPYYWSGFVVSGNTASLKGKTPWEWIALGLVSVIGIGFLLYRRTSSKAA